MGNSIIIGLVLSKISPENNKFCCMKKNRELFFLHFLHVRTAFEHSLPDRDHEASSWSKIPRNFHFAVNFNRLVLEDYASVLFFKICFEKLGSQFVHFRGLFRGAGRLPDPTRPKRTGSYPPNPSAPPYQRQ